MGFSIDTRDLEIALEDVAREEAEEAANRAFSRSQEILVNEGDEQDWEVFPVVQSGRPPQWDGDAYRFSYPHVAAPLLEFGTAPHEIKAKRAEVLAFEWPDAPQSIQEQFEDTFPTVFFKEVEHPGTPALRYVHRGMQAARRWLEGRS